MAADSLELNLTSPFNSANDQALELHGTRCSFCGLGEGRVERLFEGRSCFICNDCIHPFAVDEGLSGQ
ncbi:MAG: ClpX C4-type zinc finger protein [Blastocatellia bacterium]